MEWHRKRIDFLKQNYDKMNIDEIAEKLGVTSNAVAIKAHRLRLDVRKTIQRERVAKNICREMVARNIDPKYFRPTRDFYRNTGIGQKRFWQLFRGEKNMTDYEHKAIAKELGIPASEAFNMKQTSLFLEE